MHNGTMMMRDLDDNIDRRVPLMPINQLPVALHMIAHSEGTDNSDGTMPTIG